jgi:hypothetical protein
LAFTQKLLSYQITFASGGTLNLSGLRSTCEMKNAGTPSGAEADIVIYGMTLSSMNELTVIGATQMYQVNKNTISIQAGDERGMSLIFTGTILQAFVDAQAMPEVCFRITAIAGAFENVMKSKPSSFQGSADVAQIAEHLAKKMGLSFENSGVKVKLSNPYSSGSYRTQMLELAEHAGIQWTIDRGTLAIWNPGQSRKGGGALISPKTGMVGYPAHAQPGVIFACLFQPPPALQFGSSFTLESDLTPASGQWTVQNLTYLLESITHHGKWFCIVEGTRVGREPGGDQG